MRLKPDLKLSSLPSAKADGKYFYIHFRCKPIDTVNQPAVKGIQETMSNQKIKCYLETENARKQDLKP